MQDNRGSRGPKSRDNASNLQRKPKRGVAAEKAVPGNADKSKNKKRKQQHDEKATSPDVKRSRPGSGVGIPSSERSNSQATARDVLLDEIKALGGDEEDLALIGDIESDSEHGDDDSQRETIDPALQQELHALAAQLGFSSSHSNAAAEKRTPINAVPQLDDGDNDSEHSEDAKGDEQYQDGDQDDDSSGAEATETFAERQGSHLASASNEPPHRPTVTAGVRMTGLKKQFKSEPRADWHAVQLAELPQPTVAETHAYTGAIESLKAHAWELLEIDAEGYSKSVLAAASHKFLSTIMSSGTLSDKVSALTLAIQESPVHNIKAFDTLMSLAAKRSRGQAIGALGALVDLLGPGLILPTGRRLRPFHQQPGLLGVLQKANIRRWTKSTRLPGEMTEGHLISWAYEDWLKSTYFKMIQLLEVWCSDEIEYSRVRSLDFVYALLKDKPEQESNLLRLLVNKLGDPDRKISSRASYLLLQLQNSHPGMKVVIIRAIEQEVLLRPGQTSRARYYAVATLNQTILSKKDPQTAEALLRIYFEIFVELLKGPGLGQEQAEAFHEPTKKGPKGVSRSKTRDKPSNTDLINLADRDTVEKLVSAVLTGINRAAPFLSDSDPILHDQIDTLFRIAHSSNFNTSIQALILIQQLSVSRHIAFDRFYRTLYESLLDPRLVTSSKQALYLNLMLRSLKADVDTRRIKAFVKRMIQVLSLHQPPFACGILYIVLQLRRQFPDIRTLLEEAEEHELDGNAAVQLPSEKASPPTSATTYDGRKRDPEHANAQHSCLWEIMPFLQHFHPSVSVIAEALLSNDETVQRPELESHSLIRFLDKFVYRNPKATEAARGVSIMQPLGKKAHAEATAINHPNFWNKKIDQVAVDDVFFHHYFQQAGKPGHVRTTGAAGPIEDSDDEDEDEIWKALTSSHPDGPMDGSDDSDLDFGDLDSDMDDDEGADVEDGHGDMSAELQLNESLGDSDGSDDAEDGLTDGIELFGAVGSDADSEVDEGKNEESRASRRKRLRALPTFASIDDYAELLGQEEIDA